MTRYRWMLLLILALMTAPAWIPAAQEPGKLAYFEGKVTPLADLVAKQGSKLDADASPHWMILTSSQGRVYPLLKDAGGRMFFKDPVLLNRPMRLTGRLVPGSEILQVLNVHSLVGGKLHDVYYWCDICTIRGFEAGICECCGAPMERREELAK